MAHLLPLYDGALRRRIEIQQAEEEERTGQPRSNTSGQQSMTMQEALAMARGESTEEPTVAKTEDMATLDTLNAEGANSPFGPMFDYSTG